MPTQLIADGSTLRRPARRLVVGASSVLLSLALCAAAVTPADAAAPRPAATLSVARSGAAAAPDVALTGRVTEAGRPAAGRLVEVQSRTAGTAVWHTIRRVRTAADGTVHAAAAKLRRTKEFRLRTAAAAAQVVTPIAVVPVATSVQVTAVSATTPTAGDAIALTGTTSPGLTGARVHLQLLVDGTWTSVSSSVVAPDATFRVAAIATAGGDQQYRAIVFAAAGRPEAVSDPQATTVYAWYRLADLAPVSTGANALVAGRFTIAGTPYAQALGQTLAEGSTASAVYALHNRCLAFRATAGPTSDSDAGFYGILRARADDDVAADRTLDRGSVASVQVDVTGASVLRLSSTALTGNGDAAWGDPEVLCAGV